MVTNKVSAALSDTDKVSVMTAIGQARKKLPFLINLNAESRKKARKMGPKSIEFVNLNLQGAQSFGSAIPAIVDVNEFAKDVNLVNQLLSIRVELAALLEGVDDTMLAAGSDAMQTADRVYSLLKTAAKNDAGVKGLISDIARRYEGQSKPRKAQVQ
ncbi:MAG: hypothetical protein ACYCZO_03365 [Daejeonella sp.]